MFKTVDAPSEATAPDSSQPWSSCGAATGLFSDSVGVENLILESRLEYHLHR
jgi:hypothetical protein